MTTHGTTLKRIENEFVVPNKIEPFETDLSYNELKMLHYLKPVCPKDFSLPLYLSEYIEDAEKLINKGFLGEADIFTFLETKKVNELKGILKSNGFSSSGLKKDIIQRILTKVEPGIVINYFGINNYYSITQKGKDTIKKYPRIVLDSIEFDFMTNSVRQYITKDILIENIDFVEANVKFLYEYEDYNLSVKAFILALDKNIESNKHTINRLYRLFGEKLSDMFERLYNISIPENVFHQVRRYLYSLRELKRTPKDSKCIISKYTIQTMKDERVCEYCKSLQGKTFLTREAQIGINYPPFYKCKSDFCRCFAAFNFDIIE